MDRRVKAVRFAGVLLAVILAATPGNKSRAGVRHEHRTPATKDPIGEPSPARAAVQTQMKNVDLRIDPTIILQIHHLRGRLIGTTRNPPTFDDKRSFVVDIASGEIGISSASLSDLMNRYVLAHPHSPLKNLQISTEGNRLKQTGTVHKGIDLPFELVGTPEATPDGRIRLRTISVKSAHIPVKGLMDLFRLSTGTLIDLNQSHGLRAEKDDLILNPQEMIPAPGIRGLVSAVRVEGDGILLIFGLSDHRRSVAQAADTANPREAPLAPPRPSAPNYMYFRGGTLRFGKLTMTDADLEIIDADPEDPFDFYLDKYNQQLVAGCSESTLSYGLIVFMPDFDKLGKGVTESRNADCKR
jgi:hypothetical protein